MTSTEKMNKTYKALCKRAKAFYPEGISVTNGMITIREDTHGLSITHDEGSFRTHLDIDRRDMNDEPLIILSTYTNKPGSKDVRILVNDPESFAKIFDGVDEADDTVFVKTTQALNRLIREYSPDDVSAYEDAQKQKREDAILKKEAIKARRAKNAEIKRAEKADNKSVYDERVRLKELRDREEQLKLDI